MAKTGVQRYKQKQIEHYNLDEGVAFYEEDGGKTSFKEGPLRAVQFAIVRDKIGCLRKRKEPYFMNLPKNTSDQLGAFEIRGILSISNSELLELKDSYKYFLWLYHKSQWASHRENSSSISFDKKEVKERICGLSQICSSPLLKY